MWLCHGSEQLLIAYVVGWENVAARLIRPMGGKNGISLILRDLNDFTNNVFMVACNEFALG